MAMTGNRDNDTPVQPQSERDKRSQREAVAGNGGSRKAEILPGMALCFLVQLCISIHSMEKVLSPSVKFPHKLTQAAYRWYNL